MITTIPQPIALFLPWLAAAIAAWLTTDKLSQLVNGLIIACIFLVSVALCIWASGVPLTSLTVSLVLGYVAGVFGLLKPLMDYLSLKIPSPLALLPAARIVNSTLADQGTISRAVTPQPLTLPDRARPGTGTPPSSGANGTQPPTNG